MEQLEIVSKSIDRRTKPRMECSYPAIVQGRDAEGKKFRTNAILVNLSAIGLCLVLKSEVPPATELFVIFRCSSTGPLGKNKVPLIAVNGDVVRSNCPIPGMHTLGLKIRHNRFM